MLVLDNIESVAQVRGNDASEEKSFDRLLSCLLTELDGYIKRLQAEKRANDQVFVIGTTQDLRRLDSSVLRPGRLELHFPFSLPTPAVRREVLRRLLEEVPFAEEREPVLEWLVLRTSDYSFAALKGLVTKAVILSVQEQKEVRVSKELFMRVLSS